jgi:phosphoribosylanthranilate isomerase
MSIEVKICGVNAPAALAAAIAGGADYVGFVFYPRSPRYVTPQAAHGLAAQAPARLTKVGLAVDLDDAELAAILAAVPLDMLQLHGGESPARVAQIKARFGLPVMKAVKIAGAEDLAAAETYFRVADRLLFDAKPPKEMTGALPGGNALAFDWQLLAGKTWPLPWMLSGGLDADNLAEAIATSGARALDVSSGVEDRPGLKNPDKIRAFLAAAKGS